MKILMVTMGLGIGGAETHIVELSLALKRLGHEIFVASAGGVYEKTLTAAQIPHITLPLDSKKPMALSRAYRGLWRLIRNENFDIVHSHARIPSLVCGALKKRLGFRFVTTDHAEFRVTPFLKRITDWGDYTLAVSEDLREYLLKNYDISPNRIALTVNGVDIARFSPKTDGKALRESFCAGTRAVILHISRLDKEVSSCAETLMETMPELCADVKLIIVGDGDYRTALEKRAEQINLSCGKDAILFVGAKTNVETYLAAADIVAAPSRAAMEALASGKITIVSGSQGHGGIFCEKIADAAKESNFCFRDKETATVSVLTREIYRALALSPCEKEALAVYGRNFICENYSIERMVDTQLSLYETVMQIPVPLQGDCDILVCGYYGYGNMGDENLLAATVRELRARRPHLRICVMSANPAKTRKEHLVDAVYRFDILAIIRKMKKASLFLFGGGNLLQDKTSTRSLVYYTEMLRLAHRYGKKIAIFAGGIGPVSEKNTQRVVEAISVADSISLRDERSYDFVKTHLREREIRLVFDPAILENPEKVTVPYKPYFAVIPKKGDRQMAQRLATFISRFSAKSGGIPVIISMYDGEDLRFCTRLAKETGAEIFTAKSAGELVGFLEKAQLLLSSRLHGLIYAAVAKIPMIGFSDDEKLASFLSYVGFAEYSFSTETDAEKILKAALQTTKQRTAVQARLQAEKPRFEALVKEELAYLLREI